MTATALDWGIIARAVHVLSIVVWIGGVWLVTTVLLPGLKQEAPDDWLDKFDAVERRFAPQVRIAVLLVLLSGLYMLYAYDLWDRFGNARFWWMHLMVGVWLIFAAMLYVIEPLVGQHTFRSRASSAPETMLSAMLWMHRALLALSLLAIFAAIGGSYGLF